MSQEVGKMSPDGIEEHYHFDEENDSEDSMNIDDLVGNWMEGHDKNDSQLETTTEKKQFWRKKPWDQSLSEFVVSRMAHNPCGSHAPGVRYRVCMKNGKCGATFPRNMADETDGYVDSYAE